MLVHQKEMNNEEVKEYENRYHETMNFYTDVFQTNPAEEVWEDTNLRIQNAWSDKCFVNLYRLVFILLKYKKNKDFLLKNDKLDIQPRKLSISQKEIRTSRLEASQLETFSNLDMTNQQIISNRIKLNLRRNLK